MSNDAAALADSGQHDQAATLDTAAIKHALTGWAGEPRGMSLEATAHFPFAVRRY